eukprot:3597779-Pyramimonas_sp.AAC.1
MAHHNRLHTKHESCPDHLPSPRSEIDQGASPGPPQKLSARLCDASPHRSQQPHAKLRTGGGAGGG